MSTIATRLVTQTRTPQRVAQIGVVIGALAFFFALPPVEARAPWVPVLVGIVAVMLGIFALTRDAGRMGWYAVAVGLIGIGLGVLATRSSTGNLEPVVTWG